MLHLVKDKPHLYTPFLVMVSILVLSLLPSDELPDFNVSSIDKVEHFIAYCVLSISWFLIFKERTLKVAFLSFFISSFFGILMEYLQDLFGKGRVFDIHDMFANMLGSSLVFLFLLIMTFMMRKKIGKS